MATPNVGEPGMPKVWCVLKGNESVSTMEMVLLAELDVRSAPVCGLIAKEVGLTPTLTEPPPPSGTNSVMEFVPLELAKNAPRLVVVVLTTAGSKTMPVGVLATKPQAIVLLSAGIAVPISTTSRAHAGAVPLLS